MVNCMVLFCPNRGTIKGISYFHLTKRRHNKWLRALGRDPTREALNYHNAVCSDHFRTSDKCIRNDKVLLVESAIPRLKLRKPGVGITMEKGRKERAEDWAIAAGRRDLLKKAGSLHNGYRLCAIHFEKKYFVNPEANTSRLLAQAVPTIFPQWQQHIGDHTYSKVQTEDLTHIPSSQSEDGPKLEKTSCSTDYDELLLHHEIEIKTEPASPTHHSTTNTVGTQSDFDDQETSLRRQILFLKNDNYRLILQIKKLDNQLDTKRSHILKTLTMDEFKDIWKNFNELEQQTRLDQSLQEATDGGVEEKVESVSESKDVLVKVENVSESEDVEVKVEDVEVKVEDVSELEDVEMKVEVVSESEDTVATMEHVVVKMGDVIMKVENVEVVVKMEPE